jgi:hypothetical protein
MKVELVWPAARFAGLALHEVIIVPGRNVAHSAGPIFRAIQT